MGQLCEPCPNGVCVGGRGIYNSIWQCVLVVLYLLVCSGVDEQLLPGAVQSFSGCTIVNGDLIFNVRTHQEFM